jgi:hypothetical protein
MARKKKSLIVFLLLVSAIYGFYTTIKGMSQEFNIPLPILVIFILFIYLAWKDDSSD